MDDVLRLVAAQVARTKPGDWVRGRGWDEGKLAERRYITAADLDRVAPNNPVWLEPDDRTLRRGEQLRAEDGGSHGRTLLIRPPARSIEMRSGVPTGVS